MPIGSITYQPNSDSTFAAYRPIIFRVTATNTDGSSLPPVVHCDVYINNVFYRTISKTQYVSDNGTNSTWQFDIQDCAQEVLSKYLPDNGDSAVQSPLDVIKSVYCKFRSSGIDIDGFIQYEGTAPIQGTSKNAPVAGTGNQSNSFWILNAVLQHESNPDLLTHLSYFKTGTWYANSYPLTERGAYKIFKQDSDSFAIISQKEPICIFINYHLRNNSIIQTATHCPSICTHVTSDAYDLGTAINGVPYSVTIPLSGTAPFSLGTILNKPSWMSVNIVQSGVSDISIAQSISNNSTEFPGAKTWLLSFTGTPANGDSFDVNFSGDFNIPGDIQNYSFTLVANDNDINELMARLRGAINVTIDPSGTSSHAFTWTDVDGNVGLRVSSSGDSAGNITITHAAGTGGWALILSGTPTADSNLSTLDILVANCSGAGSIHITGSAPPCVGVTVSSESLPDGVIGEAYSGSITLFGTLPISMTTLDLPAGLIATNLGSGAISITGTPTTLETGSGISLRFTNCDGTVDVNRTIDVVNPSTDPGNGGIHNGLGGGFTAQIEDVLLTGVGVCTPYTGFPIAIGGDGTFTAQLETLASITVRFNGGTEPANITMEIIINGSTVENDSHVVGGITITSTNQYTIHFGDNIQINLT